MAISAITLHQAIAIVSYFEGHARIMYRMLRDRSKHSEARTVLGAIRKLGSPTTRREVHQRLRDRVAFAQAGDLSEPLAVLEEYGHIRCTRVVGEKGGRPSETITLHPHYAEEALKTLKTQDDPKGEQGSEGFEGVFDENGKEG